MSPGIPIVNVLLPGGTDGPDALGDAEPVAPPDGDADGSAIAGLAASAKTATAATPANTARRTVRRPRGDVFIGSSVEWPSPDR